MNIKHSIKEFARRTANIGRTENGKKYWEAAPLMVLNDNTIQYLASSNNLISFQLDGRIYYFKECRRHLTFFDYIKQTMDEYFADVCSFEPRNFVLELIYRDLEEAGNLKKMRAINVYVESHYGSIKDAYNGWDLSKVGFPTLYDYFRQNNDTVVSFLSGFGRQFLEYISNDVYAYHLNDYVHKYDYQLFRPLMSIATKKLADLFGLSLYIPNCWFVRLKISGKKEKFGIITEQAPGVCPLDLKENQMTKITHDFQRKMLNLNYFDALCFQKDHKKENYFIIQDTNGYTDGVVAFDNDSPMTFFPFPNLRFRTGVHCSPVVSKGKINRPYIDEALYLRITSLSAREVMNTVREELSPLQRWALGCRFRQLKKAISGADLLERGQWNKATIAEEISGKYGKTYLKHHLECDEDALIREIMGLDKG